MNIAGIDYESVKDGDGVRTTIYVSGCSHNCYNCHNPQTHDVNYGVPFTEKLQNEIIENIKKRPFISGITWSGGDPLHENCLDDVLKFTNKIRLSFGQSKTIWLYTGYLINVTEQYNCDHSIIETTPKNNNELDWKREEIIRKCNVVVDGRYIDSLRNISKKWAGSDNQRVIDIPQSLQQGKVVLYCD